MNENQKKGVHNSRDPLKLRTLIYWHNKKYIFPCLASFRSKVKPVYQKRRRNAARQESFYHPWHSAKFGAPTARWYFKNSCSNPFLLSFLSKWLWLSVIKALNAIKLFIAVHKTYSIDMVSFRGEDESKIIHRQPPPQCAILHSPSWGYFFTYM